MTISESCFKFQFCFHERKSIFAFESACMQAQIMLVVAAGLLLADTAGASPIGAFTCSPGLSVFRPFVQSSAGMCRRNTHAEHSLMGRPAEGRHMSGLAGASMQIKVQKDKKRDGESFQRWWDPAWRQQKVAELKVHYPCHEHTPTPLTLAHTLRYDTCRPPRPRTDVAPVRSCK